MRHCLIPFSFFKIRSAVFGFAAVGLFCACVSGLSYGQRAGGDAPSRFMERIDQEEGVKRMAAFREVRLEGDFCFRFELVHKPRRGKNVYFSGTMWGSWNEFGPVSRIQLFSNPTDGAEVERAVEFIVQNGERSAIWKKVDDTFMLIEGEAVFAPLMDGLVYTAFDLQMPFIYWDDFKYEGPSLALKSRVAQQFLMYPPVGSAAAVHGVEAVRIGIDDTYNALLGVEVLGEGDAVLTDFSVGSVQKVQGQYIVKRISILDRGTRDKTTFEVQAASLGLGLSAAFFDPLRSDGAPEIPEGLFEVL